MLAVIPARGGSKGLPGKNIRPLAGLPLIAHSIRCAALCPEITRTVVSTDSDEIADVARANGASVPFRRPPELAQDASAMWDVIQHALRETERVDGVRYESVLLLDPTSPGRLPADVSQAAALLDAPGDCDGVVAVSEPDFNPYWHSVVDVDGYMRDLFPQARTFERRQDVPIVYRINGALYLWRRSLVTECANWRDGRHRMLVIPESRALHFDELEQFELAELRIRHGRLRLPWLEEH